MFARILYLFIVIPVFLTPDLLSGQSNSFCGYYRAVSPNGTDPDSLVYDRFGNVFDMEDLIPTLPVGIYPVAGCGTGYFNVTYAGGAPQEAQLVVCDVLSYVSSVIQQRQGQNSCGLQPFGSVEIQVGWISFSNPDTAVATQLGMSLSQFPLPAGWAAIGSPFYSTLASNDLNCNEIIPEQAIIKINGGKGQGTPTIFDGRILLNSDFTWNYDTEETNFTGADMKTAILHETMHVLGFASSMGVGLFGGAYTLWDQTLRTGTYDPVNGSSISQPAISSMTGCGRNCWETVSGFGALAINSCNGNGQDIVVGDGAIAPIQGDANVNPNPLTPAEIGAYINMLSHLSLNCNGQSESYVMRPVFGSGEYQRTLTLAEQQILCALGYSIPAIDCNGCYVVAQQDAQIEPGSECCFRAFHVCVGETFEILKDELLCNDLSGDNQVTITALWHQVNNINDPVISVVLNASGTGWDITVPANVKAFKSVSLFYTLSGCECRQHNGRVQLFIDHYCPATAFTEDPCDNLLRDGGFEDAKDNTSSSQPPYALGGWPMLFQGHVTVASPDIYKTSLGNHYLGLVNFGANQEAINLELQKCIKPGCELNLSLDLSSLIDNGVAIPALQVWGSETRPCPAITMNPVPLALNCDIPTECAPGDVFNPVCIFTNIQAQNTLINFDNPNFSSIENLTWLNETNEDVCFLTFVNPLSPGSGATIFLDNILAEIRCEPEVSCNAQPAETCEGQAAGLTFTVCATELPEYINFTTITPVLNLPSGWTLVGDAPQPFNLTEGQCVNVNLQVQMPAGTPAGAIANIVLNGTASGLCTELEWSCEAEVTVVDCDPNFTCPCTGPNDLNIDAGAVSPNPNDPNISPLSIHLTAIPAGVSNTIFSPNTLQVPCLAIKGNLIIDDNYDLFILGGEIRMQPGARIIVAPGSTLKLGYINAGSGTERGIHGCEQMWRSIEVQPGGNLYTAYNVIQDAEYAFDLHGTASNLTSLNSYQNDFDRNHVGIRVNNASPAALIQPFPFAQNRFRATSALLPEFSNDFNNWDATAPYSGLSLANTTFFAGTPGDPTSGNEFNGLRNGILADRSALDVHYARILNIQDALDPLSHHIFLSNSVGIGMFAQSCGQFNVRNCTFDGAPRAIQTQQSSLDIRKSLIQNVDVAMFNLPASLSRINIIDNDISFRGFGVVVEGGGSFTRVNIDQNDPVVVVASTFKNPIAIRLRNTPEASAQVKRVTGNKIVLQPGAAIGIGMENTGGWWIHGNDIQYANPNTEVEGGINLSKADNNKIQENTITATGNAGDNGKAGIFAIGSEHNKICCNTTDNLFAGFQFSGVSDDTKLRYSDIGNHVFGLLCGNPVSPGLTAIIGDQLHAGNAWNGVYDFRSAAHYGDVASIIGSEFLVSLPQMLPLWPDAPLSPAKPDEWFIGWPGSATTCTLDLSNCPPLPLLAEEDPNGPGGSTGTGRLLTGNESAIGRGEYGGTGAYSLATQFEGERSLYAKIKRDSSLLGQDSLVDQFFVNASQGALGALHEVERQMVALGIPMEQEWNLLLELERNADSLISLIHQTDSAYQLAPTAADSLALQNQKMNLQAQLSTGQATWQGLIGDLRASLLTNATAIIGQNATIPDTNMLVVNRKVLNRIWLETLASGDYNATQSQLDDLLDIALQCYYDGGDAVLQARALYGALAQPLDLDDALLCTGGGEERSRVTTRKTSDFNVKVVPNPTKDQFAIQATGIATDALMHLQIADLNGKIRKDACVRNGEVLACTFAPGLYICRVSVGDAPAQVVKFIVVP